MEPKQTIEKKVKERHERLPSIRQRLKVRYRKRYAKLAYFWAKWFYAVENPVLAHYRSWHYFSSLSFSSGPAFFFSSLPLLLQPIILMMEPPISSYEPSVYHCRWENCQRTYTDAELLYAHLTNDHVGRKSTGNLCLTCHWEQCDVSVIKRDHITSHLRVHVPLKPHRCTVRKKALLYMRIFD